MGGIQFVLIFVALLVAAAALFVALWVARDRRESIGQFRLEILTQPAQVSFSSTVDGGDTARLLVLLVDDGLQSVKGKARDFLWDTLFFCYLGEPGARSEDASAGANVQAETAYSVVDRLHRTATSVFAGRICRRNELTYRLVWAIDEQHPEQNPEAAVVALRALIIHYHRMEAPPSGLDAALRAYTTVASGGGQFPPAAARLSALNVIDMNEQLLRRYAMFAGDIGDGSPTPPD